MKIRNFKGLPSYFKPFVERFKSYEWINDFEPVELNILEYDQKRGSNIAPHFDDFWLWGEKIIGINLKSDTVMTFQKVLENE